MPDITLECQDCKQDFLWDEGEQQFFKDKGFEEKPKRCRDCRRKKREQREQRASGDGGGRERR